MVFVTGGTGLLGGKLIADLYSKGEQIVVLKRSDDAEKKLEKVLRFHCSAPKEIINKITWVKGDVLNYESLLEGIPEGCDVYHCAATVSFNPKDRELLLENNVDGTANLINACIQNKVRKLCHVSSIGALGGQVNGEPINENTTWSSAGKSDYSMSKYFSEMEVWRGVAEGLSAIVVNPSVILGPGNWQSGSAEFFSRVHSGMKYYTNGGTGFVYVNDVSKAMIDLMQSEQENERFLLSAESLSYKEVFSKIAKSLQTEAPKRNASKYLTGLAYRLERVFSTVANRPPRITRYTHQNAHKLNKYNGNKIKDAIGFNYTPISEAIPEIAAQFLAENTL